MTKATEVSGKELVVQQSTRSTMPIVRLDAVSNQPGRTLGQGHNSARGVMHDPDEAK